VRVIGVIPARWDSRRLPAKALADIGGLPMVAWVHRRAAAATSLNEVIVATDDARIVDAVEASGGRAVWTRADHVSGTDRVWEAVSELEADVIVNVQGDEPLLDPRVIDAVVAPLVRDAGLDVVTAAAPLVGDPDVASVVKVVCDHQGDALYFSRARVPHAGPWLHHLGLYAFRRAALRSFVSRAPGPLEESERLEQLRLLEHGERVRVVRVAAAGPSVDTPADLEAVRAIVDRDGLVPEFF